MAGAEVPHPDIAYPDLARLLVDGDDSREFHGIGRLRAAVLVNGIAGPFGPRNHLYRLNKTMSSFLLFPFQFKRY